MSVAVPTDRRRLVLSEATVSISTNEKRDFETTTENQPLNNKISAQRVRSRTFAIQCHVYPGRGLIFSLKNEDNQ